MGSKMLETTRVAIAAPAAGEKSLTVTSVSARGPCMLSTAERPDSLEPVGVTVTNSLG